MNRGGSFLYRDGKLVEHTKPTFDPYLSTSTEADAPVAAPAIAQEASANSVDPPAAGEPVVDEKRLERLQAAMVELNEADEALWTAGRKPRVEVLEQVLGEAITSAERDAAWKALNETSQES